MKPTGLLSAYITVEMATEVIGVSRAQTGKVYDIISKYRLQKYKIGYLTLLDADSFYVAAANQYPSVQPVNWPAELKNLRVSKLYTSSDAARMLGVSPRTIHRRAQTGELSSYQITEKVCLYKLTGHETSYRRLRISDGLDLLVEYKDGDAVKITLDGNTQNVVLSLGKHRGLVAWFARNDPVTSELASIVPITSTNDIDVGGLKPI